MTLLTHDGTRTVFIVNITIRIVVSRSHVCRVALSACAVSAALQGVQRLHSAASICKHMHNLAASPRRGGARGASRYLGPWQVPLGVLGLLYAYRIWRYRSAALWVKYPRPALWVTMGPARPVVGVIYVLWKWRMRCTAIGPNRRGLPTPAQERSPAVKPYVGHVD